MSDKTYSVTFQVKNGTWVTNWGQYYHLEEIDWEEVDKYSKERGHLAYGYQYGHISRNLSSKKNRTVLWTCEAVKA